MIISEILKNEAGKYNLTLSQDLLSKLEIYGESLKQWNEKINLTAIKDNEGIALKHFLDCLLITKYVDFKNGQKLIDVGTGAGFPGLVLAAAFPQLQVTLLDSTGKKLKAVSDMADKMGVKVNIINMRAEDAGKDESLRENFDFATARAVAELKVLLEYTLPFVKVGGSFISLKGAAALEEISGAANSLKVLGGKIEEKNELLLPGGDKRTIINVKKISHIPPKYPRVSAQISKKPL